MNNAQFSIEKYKTLLPVILVIFISFIIHNAYGVNGSLSRDDAICLYAGQQMVEGTPPYQSIFVNRTPLGGMIASGAIWFSKWIEADDIRAVRTLFLFIGVLHSAILFLLAQRIFSSRTVALFSALAFLAFFDFTRHAASGPQPKTLLVLFQTLSLLLIVKQRWFWAGVAGSLAFLGWQPGAWFGVVAGLFALLEYRNRRLIPALQTALGASVPLIVVAWYFWQKDALSDFIEGAVTFNLKYLSRTEVPLNVHLRIIALNVQNNYEFMFLPIIIGLMVIVGFYFWRRTEHPWWQDLLFHHPLRVILISFIAPVLWTLQDYQGAQDFYVFLPYCALGFGYFLAIIPRYIQQNNSMIRTQIVIAVISFALIFGTLINIDSKNNRGLLRQQQFAEEILAQFDEDVRVVSIGSPQFMAITHQTNPNPYLFIIAGIANRIEDQTEGGIPGWLAELETYDPDVIVFGDTRGAHAKDITRWIKDHYEEMNHGPWTYYVRPPIETQAPPSQNDNST